MLIIHTTQIHQLTWSEKLRVFKKQIYHQAPITREKSPNQLSWCEEQQGMDLFHWKKQNYGL